MNLNQNPRMEYVEISDCENLYNFMNEIVEEIFQKVNIDQNFVRTEKTNETLLDFTQEPQRELDLDLENATGL